MNGNGHPRANRSITRSNQRYPALAWCNDMNARVVSTTHNPSWMIKQNKCSQSKLDPSLVRGMASIISNGSTPQPVTVATRVITFVVGNPNKKDLRFRLLRFGGRSKSYETFHISVHDSTKTITCCQALRLPMNVSITNDSLYCIV